MLSVRHLILFSLAVPVLAGISQLQADPAQSPESMLGLPADENPLGPQPGADHPLDTPENPYAMEEKVVRDGRRLFVDFNCYGCHGGRAGGGMGPSLRDAEWLYGHEGADIFASIAEGRPHGMPAWGTKLPAPQIWKLTTYIKSLNTDLESSPPPANPSYPNPPPRRDIPGVTAGGGDQ